MSHDSGMDGDIRKLLTLLKKILKNHPQGSGPLTNFLDQKSLNLNLCFLTFVPMSPEDLDDLEDMYREFLNQMGESAPKRGEVKIEFKLNSDDIDFLKKNGIQF